MKNKNTKEKTINSRRQFLTKAGFVLASVQLLPLTAGAGPFGFGESEEAPRQPEIKGDFLKIESGLGFIPHRHDLLIPLEALENPPLEGITLKTTKTAFHYHSVDLSYEQLVLIAEGEIIEVEDNTIGEHLFRIFIPEI